MTYEQAKAVIGSSLFSSFLEPEINRCAYLTAWLSAQGIRYHTVTLQNKTHIIVTYRQSAYNPRFKMKNLIAHYDRDDHTPGANDNSAACIQLLLFAQALNRQPAAHNIRIIFTDGEEAGADGIRNQGAYRLGQGLRSLSMQDDDLFVFDLCGAGDTLILSESGIYGRDKKKTVKLAAFHRRCCTYADAACRGRWRSLPTAYSDNAGFISAGLSAQVITVLPAAEATRLSRYLAAAPHKSGNSYKTASGAEQESGTDEQIVQQYIINNTKVPPDSPFAAAVPQTWQRMHSPSDSIETLTPSAFVLMDTMLHYLATVKELAI